MKRQRKAADLQIADTAQFSNLILIRLRHAVLGICRNDGNAVLLVYGELIARHGNRLFGYSLLAVLRSIRAGQIGYQASSDVLSLP